MPSGTTDTNRAASSISTQADEQGAWTPGPWSVGYSDGSGVDDERPYYCVVGPAETAVVLSGDSFGVLYGITNKADARLISSAPDMLEALRVAASVLAFTTSDSKYDAAKEKIRAAIAKATQS